MLYASLRLSRQAGVQQGAKPRAEVALDVRRVFVIQGRGVFGRIVLERLTNHPLLEQLASCCVEIVGEERDRLRRSLYLGTAVRREAMRPASKLLDLPVFHVSHLHRKGRRVQPPNDRKLRRERP